MVLKYTTSVEGLPASSLGGGFFEGWLAPPSSQEHLDLLRNSTHVVIASDDDKVVGFGTAISDGVLAAYIPLLEVLPAYRGRGIGTELMRRLLAAVGSFYMIDVACDLGMLPFYERLGFSPGTRAAIRHYGWRAG